MNRPPTLRLAAALLTAAVCLISVPAIAAPPQSATVEFDLAAGGAAGSIAIRENKNFIMIKGTVSNLEPNATYDLALWQNSTCTFVAGDPGQRVHTFTTDASGTGRINTKVEGLQIEDLGSAGLFADPGTSIPQACGAVVPDA
jgi:hypothetical protein